MMLLPLAAVAEPTGDWIYQGKIGPYNVTLVFTDFGAGTNKKVGYYYYNDRPNTHFKLVEKSNMGDPHGYNRVVLYEYAPSGKHSGTFNGIVEFRGDGFHGTFTNSEGKKYKFNLHQNWD